MLLSRTCERPRLSTADARKGRVPALACIVAHACVLPAQAGVWLVIARRTRDSSEAGISESHGTRSLARERGSDTTGTGDARVRRALQREREMYAGAGTKQLSLALEHVGEAGCQEGSESPAEERQHDDGDRNGFPACCAAVGVPIVALVEFDDRQDHVEAVGEGFKARVFRGATSAFRSVAGQG